MLSKAAAAALVAVIICLGVIILLLYDALILRQYRTRREAWEADGEPCGFFRQPRFARRFLRASFARNRVCRRWLFRTPEWMHESADAQRTLRAIRVLYVAAIVLWLVLMSHIAIETLG